MFSTKTALLVNTSFRPGRLILVFFCLLIGISSNSFAQNLNNLGSCAEVYEALSNPGMIVHRPLDDHNVRSYDRVGSYTGTFGVGFWNYLNELKVDQVWLDSGAGLQLAIQRFHYLRRDSNRESAKTIGLMLEQPKSEEFDLISTFLLNFPHREFLGRFLEEIDSAEFGKLDLITDYYGPLSYTKDLTKVMTTYLSILKPGGKLFFNATDIKFESGGFKIPKFAYYLNLIQGVDVKRIVSEDGEPSFAFEITRNEEEVKLPKLALRTYEVHNPPTVVYEILD